MLRGLLWWVGLGTALALTAQADVRQSVAPSLTPAQDRTAVRRPWSLPYFAEGYPKAFWHRSPEATIWRKLYPDYASFEKAFQTLDGMMPKVLGEEADRTMCEPFIREYKKRHPHTLLMLHYLGDGVTLDGGPTGLMPGHYLHHVGTIVTDPLAGDETESVLKVRDIRRLNGFKKTFRDTSKYIAGVTLCPLKPDGAPDWERGEYAGVLKIDAQRGTLTVERGMFGRPRLNLPAGETYIALRSAYRFGTFNFATVGPRDRHGRSCADVVVDYFGTLFGPGGKLAYFDGIQFDVMPFVAGSPDAELGEEADPSQRLDMDGDGRPDTFDSRRVFVQGVRAYAQRLRERLPDFLLNGDDNTRQCTQHIFNGCESEGWPNVVWDWDQIFWAQGVNLQRFWRDRTAQPSFNYIFLKRKGNFPEGREFFEGHEEALNRVICAAATMFDAGLALWGETEGRTAPEIQSPPDEIVKGVEMKKYWLGAPVGAMKRLGLTTADLLAGAGQQLTPAFVAAFRSGAHSPAPVTIEKQAHELAMVSPKTQGLKSAFIRWRGFDWPGGDLLVSMNVRAAPHTGLDPQIPRMLWLRIARPGDEIDPAQRVGNFRRGRWEDKANLTPQYISCYADATPFQGVFYFRNVRPGPVEFDIEMSGGEPLFVSAVTAHRAVDAMAREFEQGVVLINPSRHAYTFELSTLFPGTTLCRIQGRQTPRFNDGQPVGRSITLEERDAIFLIKNGARSTAGKTTEREDT